MVFSSVTFLFYFLPAFLLAYLLLPWRNAVLLAASLLFYAWGEARYLPLLGVSILLNYLFGLGVGPRAGQSRRGMLALALAANLGLLGLFKYADFLIGTANALTGWDLPLPGLPLPLGISFFTFHAISYLMDVHRGEAEPERDPGRLALYIAMFPQLIAGPIVRFKTVQAEIRSRVLSLDRFAAGARLFVTGLAQKVLVANLVGPVADQMFGQPAAALGTASAWLGAICYAMQIYFDFNGYSLMALGLASMLGITFPANFDHPYASRSITEFWRRWHISLSSWFRDYLYIPLGGSRRGPWVTARNLLIVFFLCGLWHGAAWTFVAWGLYHGLFLVLERLGLGALLARLWTPLRHAYALLVVLVGWVQFRADSLVDASAYLGRMAGLGGTGSAYPVAMYLQYDVLLALAAGTVAAVPRRFTLPAAFQPAALALLLAGSAVGIAAGTYNPFIYFRF